MSRNTGLATVGGTLVLSALQGMEANAVRHARHDVLLRVDRSLMHARRQVTHASRTATMLVGIALVAFVVKDQRRARIDARATADGGPALAARVKFQFRRVTDLIATDIRFVTVGVIPPKASGALPLLDRVGSRARWTSDLAAALGRNGHTTEAVTVEPGIAGEARADRTTIQRLPAATEHGSANSQAESVSHPVLQSTNPA